MDMKELAAKFNTLVEQVNNFGSEIAKVGGEGVTASKAAGVEVKDKKVDAEEYIATAIKGAFAEQVGPAVKAAIATELKPIVEGMETLSGAVARIAGLPVPTAVKLADGSVVYKKEEDLTQAEKDAIKAASGDEEILTAAKVSELAKTDSVGAVKAALKRGPSFVLTQNGAHVPARQ